MAVSTLDQIGAEVMDIVDDQYVYDTRRIYKQRRDVLNKELEKIEGIRFSVPEGAFYTIVKLPVDDAEKFIIWMLENVSIDDTTVLLTPADAFYTDKENGRQECRVSYCVDEKMLIKALEILSQALEKYPYKQELK